jgi:hypothetical protein
MHHARERIAVHLGAGDDFIHGTVIARLQSAAQSVRQQLFGNAAANLVKVRQQ